MWAVCALVAAALLSACGDPGTGRGFRLDEALASGLGEAGVTLAGPAERAEIETADERRPAVVTALAPWTWEGVVPRAAVFSLGAHLVPQTIATEPGASSPSASGPGARRFEVRAELASGLDREILDVGASEDGRWVDLAADLSRYAGHRARLTVTPRISGEGIQGARVAWSWAGIEGPRAGALGEPERPNVLFVLVDTLRADHLRPYGYARDTAPRIERLLADRGVVVEAAYSQAPWTVPSAVSYMTSRYPGDLLHGPMESYAIPQGVETLAERMTSLGYETAAFYGNFVLRDANGFGRGFATRYTPPAVPESNLLHADSVNARALPWLRSHQRRPFFLYVHYMDPHDPYDNPEVVDGRSPFYPEYRGKLSGLWVHGVYTGGLALDEPAADVAHLTALYDTEIHYVDRAVGDLIAALDPEVLADTLVVLTADHGEELYDHGGWKHGQTLYQEQIRVPLVFRWDGRLAAGRRLAGTVQLLDLFPTLAAAAGSEASPAWQGMNLLPALAGEAPLPRRPAFAQHLASGPLRATAVAGGKKLLLFNREEPFTAGNGLIEHLWRLDLGRLSRRELYDLGADPGEKRNLSAAEPETAAALEPVIAEHLDRALPGLKILASGLPAGSRLDVRIALQGPAAEWHPYFLAPADRVTVAGAEIRCELVGEAAAEGPLEKGLWIPGEASGLLRIEARLEGAPGNAVEILVGESVPYRGGAVGAAQLRAAGRPSRPLGSGTDPRPALRLWSRAAAAGPPPVDAEVEKGLRALGYIE